MGEVYKALDTRLNRTVAIKVLRRAVASVELRSRLQREAQMIASLNHPHICVLYDIGQQDGTDFLVMEYLDGETLAARLNRGPLLLDQALEYAIQVADALDKAHQQGMVHRDLKPGNIMLTKSGAKVLDFGLAKVSPRASVGATNSDVATAQPAPPITAEGTILGTVHYMSPEQLEGKEADLRSDIFALGAVLYEMIAGSKAFDGKSQASLIGAIMEREPPREPLIEKSTPPALERTIRKCLAKDPSKRWQSAGDLRDQLAWIRDHPAETLAQPAATSRRQLLVAWTAAAVLATVGVAQTYRIFHLPEVDQPMVRFAIDAPAEAPFGTNASLVEVSFDGHQLAIVLGGKLWIRSLDTMEARPLPGTEGGILPFWSPDSRYLGFSQSGKLMKIDVTGGRPQTLCNTVGVNGGGSWSPDGKLILFSAGSSPSTGQIFVVPAGGGEAKPVISAKPGGAQGYNSPSFLPDGKHFIYVTRPGSSVFLASLDGGTPVEILKADSKVVFVQPGYLLFVREQTLMAQQFDSDKRVLTGNVTPIAEQIGVSFGTGRAAFSASWNGVLAFRSGGTSNRLELVWYNRNGKEMGKAGDVTDYRGIALSPDGTRTAVHIHDEKEGGFLWIIDLIRGGTSRFSFNKGHSTGPVWSPDGRQLVYDNNVSSAVGTAGGWEMYQKSSDGTGEEKVLFKDAGFNGTWDWSSDGKYLLYDELSASTQEDLWVLPLTGETKPSAFANSAFREIMGRFSPDGRWIAYASDETGRFEVYIQPFDRTGGKHLVSTAGGAQPLWNRNGKEIFFLDPNGNVMSAGITVSGNALRVDVPKALFRARPSGGFPGGGLTYVYAVSADGQRFLITSLQQSEVGKTTPLAVVLNWPKMLKR
jgi:Tol biopolymer transport system component